jgi:F0F1-type ATP synthase epsilon subunit
MPIICDIVTQERLVFSQAVDFVSLPGWRGVWVSCLTTRRY